MRGLLFAGSALLATPAMAQDHSQHGAPQQAEEPEDHSAHQPALSDAQANPLGAIRTTPRPVVTPVQDAHDHSAMDHSGHTAMASEAPPPPRAFEGPEHVADAYWGAEAMAAARAQSHAKHGGQLYGMLMVERLEARMTEGEESYQWDVQGWYGSPTDRAVFKFEGEGEFGGGIEEAELQLLWGHAISPWFDLQAGLRLDVEPETTAHLALGVQGLAPYMIHLDAAAFLSDEGDLTARIEAEHDIRLTQRLILQPRVEFELSAQDIPERGVGAGLPHVTAGLRLRYEFVPEFAPYLGVEYEAATGRTADLRRAAGDDPDGLVFLIGLRTWF